MTYEYENLGTALSQYEDMDLSGHSAVDAKYVCSEIKRFQGNPFIEALPPLLNKNDIVLLCERGLIDYEPGDVKNMSVENRLGLLSELRYVRFFLPFQSTLEYEFHKALVESYATRKIVSDDFFKIPVNINDKEQKLSAKTIGNVDDAANAGFALIGYSGCGKSSALKILTDHYPQVIHHSFDDAPRLTQIVYLPVVCIPHSNFDALYVSIGKAIDDALGNLYPFYEEQVRKARGLGGKLNKVRELVELFSIGVIIFDEIQLINFDSTAENSYDSLLSLHNMTRVGIAVLGTEDAYGKMFPNLRTSRRIGIPISASSYCGNKKYFDYIVKNLFNYQWFDERVEMTPSIADALYSCTKGIIDLLIKLYSYVHVDYFMHSKRPVINAEYIEKVSDKYFASLKPLLATLTDPENEAAMAAVSRDTEQKLRAMIEEERQNSAANAAMEQIGSPEFAERKHLLVAVTRNIQNVTDDYNADTIARAFNAVFNANTGASLDEKALTKLTMKRLQNQKTDNRPKRKKVLSEEERNKSLADFVLGRGNET